MTRPEHMNQSPEPLGLQLSLHRKDAAHTQNIRILHVVVQRLVTKVLQAVHPENSQS